MVQPVSVSRVPGQRVAFGASPGFKRLNRVGWLGTLGAALLMTISGVPAQDEVRLSKGNQTGKAGAGEVNIPGLPVSPAKEQLMRDLQKVNPARVLFLNQNQGNKIQLPELINLYEDQALKPVLHALAQLYDPKNQDKVKLAYTSFSDNTQRAFDGGYGLHVVRNLGPVWVNELWDLDRETGRIRMPGEIRVRLHAFSGERYVQGSDDQYMVMRFRVAYQGKHKPARLVLEPTWAWDKKSEQNQPLQRRVPVGILNCRACHQHRNTFAHDFMAPERVAEEVRRKEKGLALQGIRNFEVITQPDYLVPLSDPDGDKRLAATHGFKGYMAFLSKNRDTISPAFREGMSRALLDPATSLRLNPVRAGVEEILKSGKIHRLGSDQPVRDGEAPPGTFQPYKGESGRLYQQALYIELAGEGFGPGPAIEPVRDVKNP